MSPKPEKSSWDEWVEEELDRLERMGQTAIKLGHCKTPNSGKPPRLNDDGSLADASEGEGEGEGDLPKKQVNREE
jgi:hypothetical protein